MRPTGRAGREGDGGAAAVEFALIVPLLVVFMLGTMSYGFFFFQASGASYAAREGARLASISNPGFLADQTQTVSERAPSAGITLVTTCYEDSGSDGLTRGDTIKVEVTWRPALAFGRVQFPWEDPVNFVSDGLRVEEAVTTAERVQGPGMTECP